MATSAHCHRKYSLLLQTSRNGTYFANQLQKAYGLGFMVKVKV